MHILGFVNSTFVGRPTGHVDIVDFLVQRPVERNKEHWDISSGHLGYHIIRANSNGKRSGEIKSVKLSVNPQLRGAEEQSVDICMGPVFQFCLDSPFPDSSEGVQKLRMKASSKDEQELDQESILCTDKLSDLTQVKDSKYGTETNTSRRISIGKTRLTPKPGKKFTDGDVSTRVQQHPFQMIREEQKCQLDEDSRTSKKGLTSISSVVRDAVIEHPQITHKDFARDSCTLERIEENSEEFRKPISKQRGKYNVDSSQQSPKKTVKDAKFETDQQPGERNWIYTATAMTPMYYNLAYENSELCDNEGKSVSIRSPVMEKMEGKLSPELPNFWDEMLRNLPKLAVSSLDVKPVMEERELRYCSPKMTEVDVQDELSFRLWELESTPKRKINGAYRIFRRLDLGDHDEYKKSSDIKSAEASNRIPIFEDSNEGLSSKSESAAKNSLPNDKISVSEQLFPAQFESLLNHSDLALCHTIATSSLDVENQICEGELKHEYPSPSSITCGASPTSLFSDDDNTFSTFQQFPIFPTREETLVLCKSSQSISSQELDMISQLMTNSPVTIENYHQHETTSASLYNDESSDLESPMKTESVEIGFKPQSFFTFNYAGKEMSSEGEDLDEVLDSKTLSDEDIAVLSDLRSFQEAKQQEPRVEKNGGVLDNSDMSFLSSLDFKERDMKQDARAETNLETLYGSAMRPKCQNTWVPYITGQMHGLIDVLATVKRRQNRSSNFSKSTNEKQLPQRPHKRSVKFSPVPAKEASISTSIAATSHPSWKLPLPKPEPTDLMKDDDEHIYPSVKSWEVEEEEVDHCTTPASSRSSRLWRRSREERPRSPSDRLTKAANSLLESIDPSDGPSIMTSRRRWRRPRQDPFETTSPGESAKSGWGTRYESPPMSLRHRIVHNVPCAGKLFSWPQRFAHFKPTRTRSLKDCDTDSYVAGDESVGRSARQDAQQVRSILKGRQKHISKLTVADILRENFSN